MCRMINISNVALLVCSLTEEALLTVRRWDTGAGDHFEIGKACNYSNDGLLCTTLFVCPETSQCEPCVDNRREGLFEAKIKGMSWHDNAVTT